MPSRRQQATTAIALVTGLLTGALLLAAPVHAASKGDGSKGARRAPKVEKREKALLNMVEQVSFPHEDVAPPTLVKAPKVEKTTLKQAAAKQKAAAVRDSQPGVVFDAPAAAPTPTAPPPPPAAPERVPAETIKPKAMSGETGNRIDALVAKAFDPTEVPAAKAGPSEAPATGAPNREEIDINMKAVRSEVKTDCRFGERGSLTVRVEVGAGGRVANVTPEGPFSDHPSAKCVAQAVKKVKFPASSGASFRYPFAVK